MSPQDKHRPKPGPTPAHTDAARNHLRSDSPGLATETQLAAQNVAEHGAAKDTVKIPYTKTVAKDAAPTGAANGDDQIMSAPQPSAPSSSIAKGQWKQITGAAKITWGKLTDDELLTVEGHAQKLAGLIQERYGIAQDEAEKQVKIFFEKHKS